jgi:drug/metabolite transporter (DMT)-like permease
VMIGIAFMLIATLAFSINDVLGKFLVATYSVGQILLMRSLASLLVLSPFVYREGIDAFRKAPQPLLQIARVALGTLEVACFYAAVVYISLADAISFYLASPIYVTALSALLLKERVGIWRWSAVLIGFVGVVVALNPSAGSFGIGSLIALAGSIFYAFLILLTRKLNRTSNVVLAATQASGSLIFGLSASFLTWTPIALLDFPLLLLLGVVSIGSIVLVNQSLKLAPASVVIPYQYTMIVWAVVFGYIFFGDEPQMHTIIGACIIVASGLFIFLRERRVAPEKDPQPIPER